MTFNIINLETWDRKEYFNHYFNQQTTFSVTKEFDITLLKSMIKNKGYKLYPALIYIIVNIINQNKVFRTGINSEGNLGYWDKLTLYIQSLIKKLKNFLTFGQNQMLVLILFIIVIRVTYLNIKIKMKCFLKNQYLKTQFLFR